MPYGILVLRERTVVEETWVINRRSREMHQLRLRSASQVHDLLEFLKRKLCAAQDANFTMRKRRHWSDYKVVRGWQRKSLEDGAQERRTRLLQLKDPKKLSNGRWKQGSPSLQLFPNPVLRLNYNSSRNSYSSYPRTVYHCPITRPVHNICIIKILIQLFWEFVRHWNIMIIIFLYL